MQDCGSKAEEVFWHQPYDGELRCVLRGTAAQVAQGVSGSARDEGSRHKCVSDLVQGFLGMQGFGSEVVEVSGHQPYGGELRFVLRSPAAEEISGFTKQETSGQTLV